MSRFCWSCGRTYSEEKHFCEKDGARLVLQEALAGRTVAKSYRLQGLIGEGGFGQVYVALADKGLPEEGLSSGMPVALKIIMRKGQTIQEWDKLKRSQIRETEVAQKLRHDGLIRIYDSGEDQDLDALYIVMPLGGRDLKTILSDEGPSSSGYNPEWWCKRILSIGIQVCEGLAFLHSQKIYHRDVKPHNVMESSGRMLLIDYGIAKDLHAQTQTGSTTDVARGTPEYMCPDYFQGNGHSVDWAQVDQYSFGVLMYELCAGVLPFDAPAGMSRNIAIVDQHLKKEPAPIRSLRPEVPEKLQKVVLKMLGKEPGRRYPDLVEVRDALKSVSPASKLEEAQSPSIEISGVQVQVDHKSGKTRYVLRF